MRNEKSKITKRTVDSVVTTGEEYYIWDTEIPGYGLRITPLGAVSYIYKYRLGRGRKAGTRRMTVGRPPMTPDIAREAALELHYRVAKGENPSEEEQVKRLDKTMKEIHPIYESQYSKVYLKPSTVKNQEYLWEFVLKHFGNRRINGITKLDIEKFMIAHKETPYQANRLFALISKVFSMCEQWEFKPQHTNPCRGIRKFKEHARERYLSKEEIERLFFVLDKEDEFRSTSIYLTNLFRLLLLTGCRLGEIRDLKWEWVNLERRRLELPDSKTGGKYVPLNSQAITILENMPRMHDCEYVIASERHPGKPVTESQKAWQRIRKKAGLDNVRIHDLRHTHASIAISYLGMSLPMIGGILGHKRAETTNRYAHLADEPLKQASEMIGDMIKGKLPPTPAAPVQPEPEPTPAPAPTPPAVIIPDAAPEPKKEGKVIYGKFRRAG